MKKKFLIEKKTQGPWPYDVEAVHEGFIMKAPEVKPPTKHKVKRVPMTYEAETDPVLLARWDGEALKKKDKMVYEYISLPTLSGECKRLNELTAKNMEPDVRWKCFKSFILNEIKRIDLATPWQEVEPKWWLEMVEVCDLLQKRSTKS